MRHTIARNWILGGTVAVSALSACGTAPYQVEELGSVRAWVIGAAEEGGEALAEGTARWVSQDRCWVLEPIMNDTSIDPRTMWRAIVWPKGTKVVSENPPVLAVAEVSIGNGDKISGSGAGTDTVPSGLDIPVSCRPHGVVVVNTLNR
ncbi:MAG: hypothetical protein QOF52_490 [Propionibacteriaceae bacterium]|jgi:hypothetical protein|nr:hypothetical protein [Propionibacteriaceae bacterium]MDX6320632.1 hypothetical protein [Propionibacteriaceae bacterium]